ncbi:hypothetical protein Lal_00013443 [Lupinus albus]|nr:hypothetical protein Lal_00013443 [Lupinus albus]
MCRYRRLFSISIISNDNICSFGSWVGDLWVWNFTWRHQLFTWELELLTSLLDELKSVTLQRYSFDSWEWRFDPSKIYSFKSVYKLLNQSSTVNSDNAHYSYSIWKSKAPLKVITFAWRLFMERIPTKTAVSRRVGKLGTSSGLLLFGLFGDIGMTLFSTRQDFPLITSWTLLG